VRSIKQKDVRQGKDFVILTVIFVDSFRVYVFALLVFFVHGLRQGILLAMSVKMSCVECVNKNIMGRQLLVNQSIS